MNIVKALQAMEEGNTVVGDFDFQFKLSNSTYLTRLNDNCQWLPAKSIGVNTEFRLLEGPLKYVGFAEAFDAALDGYIIRFGLVDYRMEEYHLRRAVDNGAPLSIVREMLVGKVWRIFVR